MNQHHISFPLLYIDHLSNLTFWHYINKNQIINSQTQRKEIKDISFWAVRYLECQGFASEQNDINPHILPWWMAVDGFREGGVVAIYLQNRTLNRSLLPFSQQLPTAVLNLLSRCRVGNYCEKLMHFDTAMCRMSCGWIGFKCDLSLFSLSNSSCHPLPCCATSTSSFSRYFFVVVVFFMIPILIFRAFLLTYSSSTHVSSFPCLIHFYFFYFSEPLALNLFDFVSGVTMCPIMMLILNHSPSASAVGITFQWENVLLFLIPVLLLYLGGWNGQRTKSKVQNL